MIWPIPKTWVRCLTMASLLVIITIAIITSNAALILLLCKINLFYISEKSLAGFIRKPGVTLIGALFLTDGLFQRFDIIVEMRHDFFGEALNRIEHFALLDAKVNIHDESVDTRLRVGCEFIDHF